jgi:hypothetical protein
VVISYTISLGAAQRQSAVTKLTFTDSKSPLLIQPPAQTTIFGFIADGSHRIGPY